MKEICYPFDEKTVRGLTAGKMVSVSGRLFTGRDRFHKYLADGGECPVDLKDGAVFHCGPVMLRDPDGTWRVVAAGPTTSIREEPYMAGVIEKYGVRLIIGKGGMGPRTLEACRKYGCAYLQAVGGAAVVTARRIKAVKGVYLAKLFGPTEAVWEFEAEKLELIVGMDASGGTLYE